jgi:phosphate transport system protein
MTRSRFQHGLDELKEKLLRMGGLAEQAVQRGTDAYQARDPKLCQAVFAGEAAINTAQREIDDMALDLLAMQQPMAVDLRFILAVIKINADLERVGDQAVNVAERVVCLAELPASELAVDIPLMASTVNAMVRKALDAFISGRPDLAEQVLGMDDTVDDMNRDTFEYLTEQMRQDPSVTRQALNVLLISRNLERVADHATNIAEDVIFWIRGADGRHLVR